jgi:hypothetical protein
MTAVWKQNRDRRRAKRTRTLLSHAENEWRAEIERLREIVRRVVVGEKK